MPQKQTCAVTLLEMYKGIAFSPQAALADNISATETIIPVTDISAFPEAPSYATIGTDEGGETILYAAKTDAALSGCTRGIEGAAQAWQSGTTIARNFTNADFADIQKNIRQQKEELYTHTHDAAQVYYRESPLDQALDELAEEFASRMEEIDQDISASYAACAEKGAQLPEVRNSENLPETIESIVIPGSLRISPTSLSLDKDNPVKTIAVTRAGDGAITARSSNAAVASASVNGTTVTVTGKATGTAVITVSVAAGTHHSAPPDQACTVTATFKPVASTTPTAGAAYTSGLSGKGPKNLNEYAEAISNNASITNATSVVYIDDGSAHVKLSTGDQILVPVDSSSYAFRIEGFNHDELTGSTAYGEATATGKAGITLGMVDCLSKLSSVNSTNSNTTSWNNCEIRAKLRSTVKDSMHAAWKNVIKEVYKKTSAGGKSPTIYRTLDDLFLRAEIELLGRTIYSYAGEGSQYAYWAANNNDAARVKKSQNEAVVWAERSPAELYSEVFGSISRTGSPQGNQANGQFGISFCFCV